MVQDISVNELSALAKAVLVDVRSEKEFAEGTIPGAVNIPLFNNEERAIIGTIYTQESPKKAMEIGLEIASSKLPSLYKQVEMLAGKGPVMLFCWRGGMRSKSLAVVLELMGLSVYRLSGGYKAYRRSIVDFFSAELPYHVVVLRGNTGTGKTEALQKLKSEGYPVIDLESLSNNRGSVFGYIGLGPQPSQKQFETMLYEQIMNYSEYPYLVVECESKRIGRITLPDSLYTAMQEGTQILFYDSLDNRAKRLVKEYTQMSQAADDLGKALERLKKRLGKANLDKLAVMLEKQEYEDFARMIIVEYYDPLYGYPNQDSGDFDLCICNNSTETSVKKLQEYLNAKFDFGGN